MTRKILIVSKRCRWAGYEQGNIFLLFVFLIGLSFVGWTLFGTGNNDVGGDSTVICSENCRRVSYDGSLLDDQLPDREIVRCR